jgi:hypothetical protein
MRTPLEKIIDKLEQEREYFQPSSQFAFNRALTLLREGLAEEKEIIMDSYNDGVYASHWNATPTADKYFKMQYDESGK